MKNSARADKARVGLGRLIVLGLCALAAGATIVIAFNLFARVVDQNHALQEVQNDNRTWTLAQLEVELLRLQSAAQDATIAALSNDGDVETLLHEFRLRFDIFYSRHGVLAQAFGSGRFPTAAGSESAMRAQRDFLQASVPLVDGPDAALIAAMPALEAEIRALRNAVRPVTVSGLGAIVADSVAARTSLVGTFRQFAGATITLAALMALMIVLVLQQYRASERRLAASQRMRHDLDQMIEASLDAVLVVDGAGHITLHNGAAAEMFTTAGASLNGLPFDALIASEGPAPGASLPDRIGRGREDIVARSPAGRHFPAEIVVAAQVGGEPSHIVFVRDMTDVAEREETLRKAHDAARQGEEAKARFLAVMSHEMRTPLNGVLATLDLLKPRLAGDEQALRYLHIIERSGKIALDQVNNVLELARIDNSGSGAYPETAFCPAQMLADMVEQNRASARANSNDLSLIVAPDLHFVWVRGRAVLFLRVIYNLLGNAIKFTTGGRVTLSLTPFGDVPANGEAITLQVSVRDTGIGIKESDLARIFENFETLAAPYARAREGSGLGLGIARIAAETLGGQIDVVSAPGQGSTFTLIVALERVEPPAEDAAEVPPRVPGGPLAPLRILVADDNAINREVLQELLEADGHGVAVACDGHEAVDAVLGGAFDVILMDINMPECDGIEATRRLRAAGVTTPVLAVTAIAGPEQHARFERAGLCAVLLKPINRLALREALRHATGPEKPPAAEGAEMAAVPKSTIAQPNVDATTRTELEETLGRDSLTAFTTRALSDWEAAESQLPTLLAEGRLADFAQLAHRTAGSMSIVGLTRAAALFKQMQLRAQDGDCAALDILLSQAAEARRVVEADITRLDAVLPDHASRD